MAVPLVEISTDVLVVILRYLNVRDFLAVCSTRFTSIMHTGHKQLARSSASLTDHKQRIFSGIGCIDDFARRAECILGDRTQEAVLAMKSRKMFKLLTCRGVLATEGGFRPD